MARHNKRLHEATDVDCKKFVDISIMNAIVMGSTGLILNIILGAINPINFVLVNVAQFLLRTIGSIATAIVTASKQLELEANTLHHLEHASKCGQLHRTIPVELVFYSNERFVICL
jgi:hypothetical protein